MNWIPAENSPIKGAPAPVVDSQSLKEGLPSCFTSSSPEETMTIGEVIGEKLRRGSVLALRGPLGAGKTCLVKGIARFFGVEEEITSPTYTVVSEYEAKREGEVFPLYHIDAYRLRGDDDFYALGGEEYLFGGGIAVVEWSERIPGSLPKEAVTVDMEISGGSGRIIRVNRGKP